MLKGDYVLYNSLVRVLAENNVKKGRKLSLNDFMRLLELVAGPALDA